MIYHDFDPAEKAVINPEDVHQPIPGFPEICIGIFSDKIVHALAEKYHGELIREIKSCSGNMPIYKLSVEGTEIALMLPWVGAPGAIAFIEEVIPFGGKYFVFSGSCGVLQHDIADMHLIIPNAAVRDEGVSYHYQPPADEIVLPAKDVAACRHAMEALGLPYVEGKTWTTDAFFRETRGKVERRKEQGCICVEMECAALAAVAQFRKVRFAQFFWAGDNLDSPEWDKRSLSHRGASIGEKIFACAVETGKRLKEAD